MLLNYYLIPVLLPCISSITVSLLGTKFGKIGTYIISITNLFISCFFSIILFYDIVVFEKTTIINLGNWINLEVFKLDWVFIFDPLSIVMCTVVLFVSFLVHIYSISYMGEDPHVIRFFSYLTLFTFFMLLLVVSENFVLFYFGWEGIGLTSFLLINFWTTRVAANKAALKAIIVNRFGDFGLLMAIVLCYWAFNTLDFATIFLLVPYLKLTYVQIFGIEIHLITLISFFLGLALIGKSAQLGLHTWLPDAMEGPTPVSALIHAATLVTAGVYLQLRFSPFIEYSELYLIFLTFLGAFTSFFAASVAAFQYDIKRIIAYSTCSQVGYMVFACGLSFYEVSFFHLVNHAFFKSLLFLGAGSVIHSLSGEQDIRKMGGLAKVLPFTYICFLIGSLSLCGFPFLTGFYSKDLILEMSYAKFTVQSQFGFWLGSITAFLTSFYSFRLLYYTFFNRSNMYYFSIKTLHESSLFICLPIFILGLLSIFIGFFF